MHDEPRLSDVVEVYMEMGMEVHLAFSLLGYLLLQYASDSFLF